MGLHNTFVPVAGTGLTRSGKTYSVDQSFSPTWTGDHTFQATVTTRSLLPELTDSYDIGSTTKLYRHGYLSELDAVLFAQQTITLLGGWFYVSKDEGTFATDVAAGDTQIDFGKAMTVGHFVVCRAALKVEYVQVGALVSGTTYAVTRNLDGTGANDWPAGTPFCVLGTTGDGRVELNAYDTPRASVIQQGATYNAQTEVLRFGDLNGGWGYVAETWGMAVGEYASGKANITVDPTNGVRIRGYATTRIQLAADGSGFLANSLISWDTSGNLTVAGNASIAGWTVNAAYLAKDTGTDNTSSGMAPTDYPFYGGATYANRASAPFRVTPAGALVATSATITGSVTATSGAIGGWTLGATSLSCGTGATTVGIDSGGTNPAFYAGSATPGSAPFRVTQAGALTATAGAIAGFTITSLYLYSGTGANTAGVSSDGFIAFWAGDASGPSAPFRVTPAGALVASSATITGTVNATAGYFGDGATRVAIEAAGLNVSTTGSIRGGQTAYDTGTGFWMGYSSGAYKLSIGNASGARLEWTGTYLNLYSADIALYSGAVQTGSIQSTGNLLLGTNITAAATTSFVHFATAQTYNTEAMGAGDVLLGDNSASKANLLWDVSAGKLLFRTGTTESLAIGTDGLMSIAAAGGIFQGTGTFASPTTALKIYNSGGVGLVEMWGSGVKQVYMDTTGALMAGGGNVHLDSTGIWLPTVAAAALEATKDVVWKDSDGAKRALLWGQYYPQTGDAGLRLEVYADSLQAGKPIASIMLARGTPASQTIVAQLILDYDLTTAETASLRTYARLYPGTGTTSQSTGYLVADSSGNGSWMGGKLGVGVAPSALFHIQQAAIPDARITWTTTTSYGALEFYESGSWKGTIAAIGSAFATVARRNNLELITPSEIGFWPGQAFAGRWYASGGLYIGTTPADPGAGILQAEGYKSSDGTAGVTTTYSIRKGDDSGAGTLTVKNGLVISFA